MKFEDLIAGPEMTGTMFEFLGLNGFDTDRVTQILGQKLNAQQVGDFCIPLIGPLTSMLDAGEGEGPSIYG